MIGESPCIINIILKKKMVLLYMSLLAYPASQEFRKLFYVIN